MKFFGFYKFRIPAPRTLGASRLSSVMLGMILAGLGWAGPHLQAQARGPRASLVLTTLDPSGARVPLAGIEILPANGSPPALATGLGTRHGVATIANLPTGNLRLEIRAAGFEPRVMPIRLHAGVNRIKIHLALAAVEQSVTAQTNSLASLTSAGSRAFSLVLTPKQIQQLPDDPDQFEQALQAMAGPAAGPLGATMVVDGFAGGQLPPKSQIQQIIFHMNPFSAANHTATGIRIEIITKPGVGAWHGQAGAGFRGTRFDARNAFSPVATPEAYRRGEIDMQGPLEAHQSSVFFSLRDMPIYQSTTILAKAPASLCTGGSLQVIDGNCQGIEIQPSREVYGRVQVNQALSSTQIMRAEYQRNYTSADEQGVGNFNLPSRATYDSSLENLIRISLTGSYGSHAVNQMRFQADWQNSNTGSSTLAPSLNVNGAFNEGGAQAQTAASQDDWQLDDDFDYSFGHQVLHAGLRWNQGLFQNENVSNQLGSFTFASYADFLAGKPSLFTRRVIRNPLIGYRFTEWAGYIQDDWQPRDDLSFSLGLRYEGQSHVRDNLGLDPRFMATWAPFPDHKTVLRLGLGIFRDWFAPGDYSDTLLENGISQYDLTILDPSYPNPFLSGAQSILPPSIVSYDPNLTIPYREQASLMISRTFNGGFRLMTGYFFQRGIHLLRSRNLNAPFPDGQVPDPALGNLDQIESNGNSRYQALRVGLMHFSPRLFFAVNYALAQQLDDNNGALSLPANNYDLAADWGPAPNDARDRLFSIVSYGITNSIRLFAMFNAQSALPYNITTGQITANGQSNARPAGVGRDSARGLPTWNLNTRLSWSHGFGGAAHGPTGVMPPPGGRGHGPRGFFRRGGPGGEQRFTLEWYVQAYNVFNHVNFTSFDGVLTSPFFGRPLAAEPGRRMETGFWLRF